MKQKWSSKNLLLPQPSAEDTGFDFVNPDEKEIILSQFKNDIQKQRQEIDL